MMPSPVLQNNVLMMQNLVDLNATSQKNILQILHYLTFHKWMWQQGHIQRICLAVMTGPFLPQVLSIEASEISNAVTAGL